MRNAFLLACVLFFGGVPKLSACSAPPTTSAVQDEAIIKDLLLRGRKHLDDGKASEAQILFEQADALTRGELRTRIWLLRSWMDQGRINDTFDIMDRMLEQGAEGTAVDYIYGMGSYRRALRDQSGGMSKSVAFAFEDALQYLGLVLEADAKLYYDAWLPLAHSAWASQKNSRNTGQEQPQPTMRAKATFPRNLLVTVGEPLVSSATRWEFVLSVIVRRCSHYRCTSSRRGQRT